MPCDKHHYSDEYNYVLRLINSLQLRVKANYVVAAGDWNTDLSRFNQLIRMDGLMFVQSII